MHSTPVAPLPLFSPPCPVPRFLPLLSPSVPKGFGSRSGHVLANSLTNGVLRYNGRCPTERTARKQRALVNRPLWQYNFQAVEPFSFHGTETIFVFQSILAAPHTSPAAKALGVLLANYWADFGANGNPNSESAPDWPSTRTEGVRRGPKGVQRGSEGGPKGIQRGPKGIQRGPKGIQRGPGGPEGPEGSEGDPDGVRRGSEGDPEGVQRGSRGGPEGVQSNRADEMERRVENERTRNDEKT
eukprot:1193828-Prorocentrum_minimum.AAC.1